MRIWAQDRPPVGEVVIWAATAYARRPIFRRQIGSWPSRLIYGTQIQISS